MITSINEWKSINENRKQALEYVKAGKIEQKIVDEIISIDPSPTKKYTGWIAKQYISSPFDIATIKSYIEEYDALAGKHKIDQEKKDIYAFKDVEELKKYVDLLNAKGTASLKELENDYDVILDNDDLYIAAPNTHEASRKLGLTTFAHRGDNCDSAWCTTYKNNTHFYDYFFKRNVTFYYVLVKSDKMKKDLGNKPELYKLAFAVFDDGKAELYDANDTEIKGAELNRIRKVLGL